MPVQYKNTLNGRIVEHPEPDSKMDRSHRWERVEAESPSQSEDEETSQSAPAKKGRKPKKNSEDGSPEGSESE